MRAILYKLIQVARKQTFNLWTLTLCGAITIYLAACIILALYIHTVTLTGTATYDHHESLLIYGWKKALTFLFIRTCFVTCSSLSPPCPLPPTCGCVQCVSFLSWKLWCGNLCRGRTVNLLIFTGVSCPWGKGQDRIEGKLGGACVVQPTI